MKQIDGIQIDNRIIRYSKTFRTDGGFLLELSDGAEHLQGVFPGCSWDRFYDEIMIQLAATWEPRAVAERLLIPTTIRIKNVGYCDRCGEQVNYKYCSVSCWFFTTLELIEHIVSTSESVEEINQHTIFVERMLEMFGDQVDADRVNPTQL